MARLYYEKEAQGKMKITRKTLGKVFALMLSFVLVFTAAMAGSISFISVNTGKVKNTFKPFDTAVSNLIISKRLEHPLGEDYKIPDSVCFDFKVSLGAYFAGYTFKTTSGSVTADSQGNLALSVKPGQAVSIQGIDEGTAVTVTEIQNRGGFSVKGEAVKSLTIPKDEFAQAEFTNIYAPEKVTTQSLTLKGTKKLTGRDFKAGDEFTFVLEMKDGEGYKPLSEKTISYNGSADFNKFDFTDAINALTFEKVGAYTFRVFEKAGKLPGMDYDKTINYFHVNVTDVDMDGKLEIGSIDTEQNTAVSGQFDITVDFNNGYTFPKDISVKVDVNKTVKNSGGGKIGPENFKFALKGNGQDLTATSYKNGKAYFSLNYSHEDIGKTFEYTVTEINDKRKHVTYSTASYKLSVTISLSDDNTLIADVKVAGKAYTDKSIVFKNVYKSPSAPDAGERAPWALHIALILALCAGSVALAAYRKKKNKI